MREIDINCDLGEGFANDHLIMPYISSANIACGLHAGNPSIMHQTVCLARKFNVSPGAHPGYPDKTNFGRLVMAMTPNEIEDLILYQVGALAAIARVEGAELSHVKPHGALYNLAMRDSSVAEAIVKGVSFISRELTIYAMDNSELMNYALQYGLPVLREVFPDRLYQPDGQLVPRNCANSIADSPEMAAGQALDMVLKDFVRGSNGHPVYLKAETLCIHGDNAAAPEYLKAIRTSLENRGITIKKPGRI